MDVCDAFYSFEFFNYLVQVFNAFYFQHNFEGEVVVLGNLGVNFENIRLALGYLLRQVLEEVGAVYSIHRKLDGICVAGIFSLPADIYNTLLFCPEAFQRGACFFMDSNAPSPGYESHHFISRNGLAAL